LLVDTQGLVLKVKATGAHVPERDGAYQLLEPLRSQLPRLQIVWADQGYSGEFETWIQERLGWRLEIVRRTSKKQQHAQVWATARQRQREGASVVEMWAGLKSGRGIEVLPRRWVVSAPLLGWDDTAASPKTMSSCPRAAKPSSIWP
jgi:transposase